MGDGRKGEGVTKRKEKREREKEKRSKSGTRDNEEFNLPTDSGHRKQG